MSRTGEHGERPRFAQGQRAQGPGACSGRLPSRDGHSLNLRGCQQTGLVGTAKARIRRVQAAWSEPGACRCVRAECGWARRGLVHTEASLDSYGETERRKALRHQTNRLIRSRRVKAPSRVLVGCRAGGPLGDKPGLSFVDETRLQFQNVAMPAVVESVQVRASAGNGAPTTRPKYTHRRH